jgi:hypothetical protein
VDSQEKLGVVNCSSCNTKNLGNAAYCVLCGDKLEPSFEDEVQGKAKYVGPDLRWCFLHPNVETVLRCGGCDRPICVTCVVQHPVGVRCRECARLRKLPQFEVSPLYYTRAVGAGIVLAFAGLAVLVVMAVTLPGLGFSVVLLGLVAVGYVVGEGVSRAVNRKVSRGLQYIAAASVIVAYVLISIAGINGGLYGILALAAAIYVAVSRIR